MTDESTKPQPPARDNGPGSRLRFISYFAFGAVLLLALGIFVWPDSSDEDSVGRLVEGEPETEEFGPYDDPGDDGEVEIVEKGYTPITDVAGEDQVSWGAIIANTSEASMARVNLEIRILDADGESLNQEHGGYGLHPTVAEILPGQSTGTGDVLYMDGPGAEEFDMRVESVEWWPADDPLVEFAEMTVSEVSSEWINQGGSVSYWGDDEMGSYVDERGDLRIDFRLDSRHAGIVEPGAAAVFRDEDGEIVGGSPPGDINGHAVAPPGWSEQYIVVKYGPPEDIDEDAIEVYAYSADFV